MARDDEELAALLGELEDTLGELRAELDRQRRGERRPARRSGDETGRRSRGDSDRRPREGRRDRREPPFDPPNVTDVLRFTEEYTLPTLIATLEAATNALRLVQRLLGAVTPGERTAVPSRQDPLAAVSDTATTQLADRLVDLRTALEETTLPNDDASREIVTDARELVDEIERRVRESQESVRDHRDRTDGVEIAVGDPAESDDDRADERPTADRADERSTADRTDDDGSEDASDTPNVDVEAELRSIKRELDDDEE